VLFPIRDEPAVEKAMEMGIGQTIIVPLGGTKDSRFIPLKVEVMVEMLSAGKYFSQGGRVENAGSLAILRAKNITIVVSTQPGVLCDYSMYLGLGQDPKKFDVIIVKLPHTPYHLYDAWAVRNMTIDVPGAASPNIRTLGHEIVSRPMYPLDEDMSFIPHVEVFP
jgi:microcystin degradation protein MlrC